MSVQHVLAEHFKEDVFDVLLQFGLALDDSNCTCKAGHMIYSVMPCRNAVRTVDVA